MLDMAEKVAEKLVVELVESVELAGVGSLVVY